MTTYLIALLILTPLAAVGILFALRGTPTMKKRLRVLDLLAQFTPGEAGFKGLTPGYRGTFNGLPFAVELPKEKSNSGIGLRMTVFIRPLFQLEMHRGIDVMGADGARGQMDFDIGEDPHAKAPLYLNDPVHRQYIWNFLTTGFSSFIVAKDRVLISMPNCDMDEDFKPAQVHIQLMALVQLAKDSAQ